MSRKSLWAIESKCPSRTYGVSRSSAGIFNDDIDFKLERNWIEFDKSMFNTEIMPSILCSKYRADAFPVEIQPI
jgi:hypothetical protein